MRRPPITPPDNPQGRDANPTQTASQCYPRLIGSSNEAGARSVAVDRIGFEVVNRTASRISAEWIDFITCVANDDVPCARQAPRFDVKSTGKVHQAAVRAVILPDNFPHRPAMGAGKRNMIFRHPGLL